MKLKRSIHGGSRRRRWIVGAMAMVVAIPLGAYALGGGGDSGGSDPAIQAGPGEKTLAASADEVEQHEQADSAGDEGDRQARREGPNRSDGGGGSQEQPPPGAACTGDHCNTTAYELGKQPPPGAACTGDHCNTTGYELGKQPANQHPDTSAGPPPDLAHSRDEPRGGEPRPPTPDRGKPHPRPSPDIGD